jgi:hypothetical protein
MKATREQAMAEMDEAVQEVLDFLTDQFDTVDIELLRGGTIRVPNKAMARYNQLSRAWFLLKRFG